MNEHDENPHPGLRQLRQEVAPARDLWPGIQARLRPRRHFAPWISLALAASLVVGLAINVSQQMTAPAGVSQELAMAAQPEAAELHGPQRALVKANLKIVSDAERQLLDALKQHPDSQSLKRLLDSNQRQRRDLRRLLAKPAV